MLIKPDKLCFNIIYFRSGCITTWKCSNIGHVQATWISL